MCKSWICRPILQTYGGVTCGTVPYHPAMMVKVLLYAYAVWIPASRHIARKLEEDVAFRVLVENQRLDFRTFSDFRQQHLAALAKLFVEVLTLCRRTSLVTLGHIAVERMLRTLRTQRACRHNGQRKAIVELVVGQIKQGVAASASSCCEAWRRSRGSWR